MPSKSLAVGDSDEKRKDLVEYDMGALDALGIKKGPSLAEVKWCNGSPCLIEVGSQCHGGEGTFRFIVDRTIGYNQDDTESR